MQDLYNIVRLNSAASEAAIPRLIEQGKFVVGIYNGLNYINHEAFDTPDQAEQFIDSRQTQNDPGETLVRRFPSPVREGRCDIRA